MLTFVRIYDMIYMADRVLKGAKPWKVNKLMSSWKSSAGFTRAVQQFRLISGSNS